MMDYRIVKRTETLENTNRKNSTTNWERASVHFWWSHQISCDVGDIMDRVHYSIRAKGHLLLNFLKNERTGRPYSSNEKIFIVDAKIRSLTIRKMSSLWAKSNCSCERHFYDEAYIGQLHLLTKMYSLAKKLLETTLKLRVNAVSNGTPVSTGQRGRSLLQTQFTKWRHQACSKLPP